MVQVSSLQGALIFHGTRKVSSSRRGDLDGIWKIHHFMQLVQFQVGSSGLVDSANDGQGNPLARWRGSQP